MLGKQGIISPGEAQTICKGLEEILKDFEEGKLNCAAHEDIYMNIEVLLIEKIGQVGKLHTGRSQ